MERDEDGIYILPPWICQPKIRKHPLTPAPFISTNGIVDEAQAQPTKRASSAEDEETLVVASTEPVAPQIKKKLKVGRGPACEGESCKNTRSDACVEKKCKLCCRSRSTCPQHLSVKARKKKIEKPPTPVESARCLIL